VYDNQQAFDLASEAVKIIPDDEQAVIVWLLAAHAVSDIETMRQADARLLMLAPDNSLGHYEAGLLAAYDGKWEKAERELVLARQLGFDEQTVQAMLDSGISKYALVIRVVRLGVIAIGLWFVGLVLLLLTGSVLSKATLRTLASFQPGLAAQISPKERRLRSIYRAVITILSLYFYISIPFVILLLLLFVAGVFYVFIILNTIPIYFALVLVFMVIGSLIAIGRAIFTRVKDVLPGRELSRTDAPDLWALVEQVANKLEVAPVETIQLTPDALIGVTEKGNILKKIRGTGKRKLLLGMGGLAELTQVQLAGILAHEYGHFSNRDTAGGNLAHQVYASLNNMALRLIKSGSARLYNPVWLFILGYQRIFLRVTLGASRLQEILADRYAAAAYGSENFIDGLLNHIHQSIAFPLMADSELKSAFATNRTIVNLYDLPLSPDLAKTLDSKFAEAVHRTTSKYDSHPSPQERIRLVKALNIPNSPAYENSRSAMELFPNPEQLQREMTAEISRLIMNKGNGK
jgi:Zn-dependent protease with chaperone function